MNALCDTSECRSRIIQQELGTALRVNEEERTEMVGNSMRLYEKLTISPYRFAKLSDPCAPSSATPSCLKHSILETNQHSTSLPFLPSYDRAQSSTCLFFGTIGDTVVCKSKFNDATTRQSVAGGDNLLETMATATIGEKLDYTTSKQSEELLDSISSDHSHEDKRLLTPLVSGQDISGVDVMMLVRGAKCLSIGDGLQSVYMCNDEVLSSQPEGCTCVGSGKKVTLRGEVPPKALAQDQNEAHGEQDAKEKATNQLCSQPVEIFEVGRTPPLDGPVQGGYCSNERYMITKEDDHDRTSQATSLTILQERDSMHYNLNLELALHGQNAIVSKKTPESIFPMLDVMVEENSGNPALGMNCRTCKDRGDCKCKIAEISRNNLRMENNLNDSEACCSPLILPKAVIQAVGQLRFWKARLALIRQQRIFSDQVFELHKLIEVQRLIAETPDVPINEMHFGVGNMITDGDDDVSSCGFEEEDIAEAPGKGVSASNNVDKAPVVVGEANSKLCNDQYNAPTKTAIVKNEEVSAWRESSSGVAPAQTMACPYPTLAASFAPGPAVAVPGHGAAIIGSPVFPVFLPRPQLTPSVQSSYGSALASALQQQFVPYCHHSSGCKVSDLSGPRTPNKKQCAHEAPTVSVASINNQQDRSLHQMRKAFSSMSSQPQRQEKEVQSGGKSLRVLGSQAESFQHEFRGSTARPQNDSHHCPKYHVDMQQQENNVKRIKEVRGWKRQKERKHQYQPREVEEVDGFTSLNPSMRTSFL